MSQHSPLTCPNGRVGAPRRAPLVILLGLLACEGEVFDPLALGPREAPGGASPGGHELDPSAIADADNEMRAQNEGLFASALKYFPSTVPAAGPKRLRASRAPSSI